MGRFEKAQAAKRMGWNRSTVADEASQQRATTVAAVENVGFGGQQVFGWGSIRVARPLCLSEDPA